MMAIDNNNNINYNDPNNEYLSLSYCLWFVTIFGGWLAIPPHPENDDDDDDDYGVNDDDHDDDDHDGDVDGQQCIGSDDQTEWSNQETAAKFVKSWYWDFCCVIHISESTFWYVPMDGIIGCGTFS